MLNYLLKESDAENNFEKTRDAYLVQGIGIPRIVFIPPEPIEIKTKVKKKIKIAKPKEDGEEKDKGENKDEANSSDAQKDSQEMEIEEESTDYEVDESKKSFRIEFVDYQDLLKSTEKEWSKLRWIAFRKYYSRKELIEYFGKKGEKVQMTNNKFENFNFQSHSSGPFGEDIQSEWLDKDSMYNLINNLGFGWRDIHAKKYK